MEAGAASPVGFAPSFAPVLTVAVVIAAILAVIDPVPGVDIVAASFAGALFRVALARPM